MWYFLSKGEFGETLTEVRSPQMAYQESEIPRLCIAPTVSQCILALSALVGRFNIYTIEVDAPEPANESVCDRHSTGEHWVTQEVLDRHRGSIPIRKRGEVEIDLEVRTNLKIPILQRMLPEGWENREPTLWDVQEGLWLPKFGSMGEVRDMLR